MRFSRFCHSEEQSDEESRLFIHEILHSVQNDTNNVFKSFKRVSSIYYNIFL